MTLLFGLRLKHLPPRVRLPVVLLLAGFWLAITGFLVWDYRQELQSGKHQSATLSKSLATHAEQVLSDARRLAYIIQDTVRTEGIDMPLKRFMATGTLDDQLILQLSLVDAYGILRSSTTDGFTKINLSDREHIQVHLQSTDDNLFISTPLVGRASNRMSVQLSSPLRDAGGALLGILVISIDPSQLTERYRKLSIGPGGLIALVGTRDGIIRLARSTTEIPGIAAGEKNTDLLRWAAPEQMPDSPATGSGSGSPPTTPLNLAPRIQELLLSSTQVDSYPLAVIVGLSRDDLLAPYFLRQRVLIGAALILTLLALAGESRHARLAQHAKESDYQLSRALRQVLAREQRLADLFRAIPDPAIAFSRISHRATGFNPPMQRLTRCSANALDGADLATFAAGVFASDVSPDRNDRIQALTRKLGSTLENSAEKRPARFEIHIDTPAPVIYEVRLEPMTDEPAGLLVLLRDITAQHRLERMTNDFAATAAHEMRTPLASILGFSELLAAGLISEHERPKIAAQIYQRAKNMSELVNDLLTLTRLETGNGGGQFSAFDLRTIIDPLMRQLPEAASHLMLDTPPTPMPVMGNVFELVTALRNAVENAFKYGEPDKGVTLRLWIDTDHHQARLTVSDHGPGISAADIDRVFKRFVRLNHRGNLEGSGLGLPLVRGVLQHHKGWAWVESSPGQGFTLHMALPLHYPTPRKTASTGTLSS